MKKIYVQVIILTFFWIGALLIEAHGSFPAKALAFKEMADDSTYIVSGTVVSVSSYWNEGRTKIFSLVEVEVEEYLKGQGGKRIRFRIPGGMAGGRVEIHHGMPRFDEGERVLLFLNPGNRYSDVVAGRQGKYRVVQGRIEGQDITLEDFIQEIKISMGKEHSYFRNPDNLQADGKSQVYGKILPIQSDPVQPQPDKGILFPLADKPAITNISPSLASAGTNSVVTISGSSFGTVQGEVWFRATGEDHPSKPNVVLPASILSWSATQIRCYVPRGVVDNYSFSAGSFSQAVYVVQNGVWSDGYPFNVIFGFREIQWFTNSATYYINENTTDCVGEGAAAQTAANTWNQYSPFVFSYAGNTISTDYGSNDKNELLWVDYNTGSIASTICWYWTESGQLDECDLIFNNLSYLWSTSSTPPADRFDVQSIALHEFGHWLKLLDLYGENDRAKTMYGLKSRGYLQRSLSIGDIQGIKYIYDTLPYKQFVDFNDSGDTDIAAFHAGTDQFFTDYAGNLGQYGWDTTHSMPLMWDYDGDGKTDISIYHIPTNQWFVKDRPGENLGQFGWNAEECVPVPGDYNGDGVPERAFYHWPTNRWFVEGQEPTVFGYGGSASIPIALDYDGDGKTDMMVYHIDSNQWFVHGIGALGQFGWGGSDCIPVPGDWNGDGKTEIAVYYAPDSEWIWRDAAGNPHFMGQYGWGGLESFPIPGDYDGDGTMERGFYRYAQNWWFLEGEPDFFWGWDGGNFMPITSQMAVYNWFRFRLGRFQ